MINYSILLYAYMQDKNESPLYADIDYIDIEWNNKGGIVLNSEDPKVV